MAIEDDDIVPVFDYCKKRVLVMGAGNILFGDDGFGPAVIEELQKRDDVPDDVYLMDIGTSARPILFNIVLSEKVPEAIIIIDSVTKGRGAGEVFEIDLDELPTEKSDDFQFHFVPTSNMLKDLRDEKGTQIIVIACEAEDIPEITMYMGLSDSVKAAVPVAADLVLKRARDVLEGR
jgi:coenzyme F420 hydrogenase subunit delta